MSKRYVIIGDNGVIRILFCEQADAEAEAEARHNSTGLVQRVMDEVGDLIYVSEGPI